MQFDLQYSIQLLSRTPKVLSTLLSGLPEDLTHQNEGTKTWSAFDIMGHLIHGEETDWIPRAKLILAQETAPFTPFDRFAQEKKSEGKTLNQLLDQFEYLRRENLKTLRGFNLSQQDLKLRGTHPALGTVTLQHLLSTWTAHDLSHMSQINRVMAKQYKSEIGPWIEYMKVMHS